MSKLSHASVQLNNSVSSPDIDYRSHAIHTSSFCYCDIFSNRQLCHFHAKGSPQHVLRFSKHGFELFSIGAEYLLANICSPDRLP